MVKTDADGTEEWSRSFGARQMQQAHSVQLTADDGFIISGRAQTAANNADVLLIRTDSEGNVQGL